jgi:hypothetical protein
MNEPSNFDSSNCPHNKYDFPDVRTSNSENLSTDNFVTFFL